MSGPLRRPGLADTFAVAAMAFALVLHVRFAALDPRPPADLGHYYWPMRQIIEQLVAGANMPWKEVDTPYTLLLAGIVVTFGRSGALMHTIDGAWLALLLVGIWLSARRAGGPIAGLVAVFVAASFPQTHAMVRIHWIHHPESAAALGALGLAAMRERLTTRVGVVCGLLLFFGLTVRPTGVAFAGLAALGVVALGWRGATRGGRAGVAFGTFAGLAWQAPGFVNYLGKKAEGAEGYAEAVGSPWPVFLYDLGWPALAVALPLAAVGLIRLRRGGPVGVVALGWVLGGLAATLLFHVGPDNFPLLSFGLAILAGVGAAAVPWPALPAIAAGVVSIALQSTQLIDERILLPVDKALKPWRHAGPMNYVRVYWDAVPPSEVMTVVDSLCGAAKQDARAACHVVASRGLFNPSWEDDGSFGLFMEGADRIDVITAAVLWAPGSTPGRTRAHALVDVRCPPGVAPSGGVKFQLQEARMSQYLESNGGRPVAVLGRPGGCTQAWYALPAGGVRVD